MTVTLPHDTFHSVFHLADVIHHFHHHHDDEHIGFIAFILKHAGDKQDHHHDEDEHHNFPAHHRHIADDVQLVSIPVGKISLQLNLHSTERKLNKFPLSQQIAESLFIKSIWQPPKSVYTI